MNAQKYASDRRARRRKLIRLVDLRAHVIAQLKIGGSNPRVHQGSTRQRRSKETPRRQTAQELQTKWLPKRRLEFPFKPKAHRRPQSQPELRYLRSPPCQALLSSAPRWDISNHSHLLGKVSKANVAGNRVAFFSLHRTVCFSTQRHCYFFGARDISTWLQQTGRPCFNGRSAVIQGAPQGASGSVWGSDR